jgi:D-sedoheptulose 7-phosphate isomerase
MQQFSRNLGKNLMLNTIYEYLTNEEDPAELNNSQYISQYYSELKTSLDSISPVTLGEIVAVLKRAAAHHKMIYICGNGGSAATASHMACDLAKGTRIAGFPYFRAIALTDSMAQLSAWANDTSYENCFSGQLEGLGQPGDILIAISGSGNSANVLSAVATAEQLGMTTIGFVGFQGGKLKPMVDYSIVVPANNIEQVEDAHMTLVHSIATALRSSIRASLKARSKAEANQNELAAPLL